MSKTKTLNLLFSQKHKNYIRKCRDNVMNVAEGAVRAGKTVDNIFAFAFALEHSKDKIHLATGSTAPNAKLNIGECNGLGLEYLFRGRCRWGKYKGNDCIYIKSKTGSKVVIFAGGAKADSFKKIRGNSYGLWIATEINLHHDNTIKEAFNRQLAAKNRQIFWDLNPSNPGAAIYKDYIDRYQKQHDEGKFIGGYNYAHFTIFDNITMPEENKQQLISQYDPTTVWYRRDILGVRCSAEGLIYEYFANNEVNFFVSKEELPRFKYVVLGIDWGGNKSKHAFQLTGITDNWKVYALRSKCHAATGTTPSALYGHIVKFIEKATLDYGRIHYIYADSAEQVLINGLRANTKIPVYNSDKGLIIDRIRCTINLMSEARLHIVKNENEDLVDAFKSAVWEPKKLEDIRLDDGSYNCDILDAFEYSFSRYINHLTRIK